MLEVSEQKIKACVVFKTRTPELRNVSFIILKMENGLKGHQFDSVVYPTISHYSRNSMNNGNLYIVYDHKSFEE